MATFVGRSLKSFILGRVKPYLAQVVRTDSIDLDSLTIEAGVLHLNDVVSGARACRLVPLLSTPSLTLRAPTEAEPRPH